MSYNIVLSSDNMTVMDEYTPEVQNRKQYQSEADLEKDIIKRLISQGYEHPDVHNINDALANLRVCLQKLNNVIFTYSYYLLFGYVLDTILIIYK